MNPARTPGALLVLSALAATVSPALELSGRPRPTVDERRAEILAESRARHERDAVHVAPSPEQPVRREVTLFTRTVEEWVEVIFLEAPMQLWVVREDDGRFVYRRGARTFDLRIHASCISPEGARFLLRVPKGFHGVAIAREPAAPLHDPRMEALMDRIGAEDPFARKPTLIRAEVEDRGTSFGWAGLLRVNRLHGPLDSEPDERSWNEITAPKAGRVTRETILELRDGGARLRVGAGRTFRVTGEYLPGRIEAAFPGPGGSMGTGWLLTTHAEPLAEVPPGFPDRKLEKAPGRSMPAGIGLQIDRPEERQTTASSGGESTNLRDLEGRIAFKLLPASPVRTLGSRELAAPTQSFPLAGTWRWVAVEGLRGWFEGFVHESFLEPARPGAGAPPARARGFAEALTGE